MPPCGWINTCVVESEASVLAPVINEYEPHLLCDYGIESLQTTQSDEIAGYLNIDRRDSDQGSVPPYFDEFNSTHRC